ncbi:MAG: hypothetical protein ACFFDT_08740 [Candidatus Hodarchaeota archaeon]
MCRLLGLWAKQNQKKSSRHLLKSWFNAWLDSTKKDHYLNKVYGVPEWNCVHEDGWGVVTLGTDHDYKIKWEQKNLDLKPAFIYRKNSLTRLVVGSPFLKSTHQILLAHARRASVNMPVFFQQVQPLLIHDYKSSRMVYLTHNGTLNSKILNDILDTELQPNSTQVNDFSDTQLLSCYIRQKLESSSSKSSIEDLWIPILQEVIDKHQEENINYQMQLIILEINENKPQLIICSALSDKSKRFMPYYRLFVGKRGGFRTICSSTVLDYFKSNHKSTNWDLDPISNKTLVNITSEGEFFYKFI